MTELSQLSAWVSEQEILLSLLISLAVIALVWRFDVLLGRYTSVSGKTTDDLRGFRGVATATTIIVTGGWIATQPLPPWLDVPVDTLDIPQFSEWVVGFLPGFVVGNHVPILVTTLGGWWALNLRTQGDDILERVVANRYDEALAPIVENVWDVTIVAAFVLLILDQWGITVAALLAPAGVLGIILGFAARETVANFFGSLSLYADETYERGDYIELENGVAGTVRDISVRSTVLQTWDGDLVNVPNSALNEAKITNKSSPTTHRRISSQVGVTYDADPERVKEALHEAAEPISETQPPTVHLRSFGDSALVFDVFVWIETPSDKLRAEDQLNMAIHRALADADIEIPFPQREIAVEREE
jgi:small-conductance mechanosensitive channel